MATQIDRRPVGNAVDGRANHAVQGSAMRFLPAFILVRAMASGTSRRPERRTYSSVPVDYFAITVARHDAAKRDKRSALGEVLAQLERHAGWLSLRELNPPCKAQRGKWIQS